MKNLELIQKLSILHCVYQVIASADGSVVEERDNAAIDYAIEELSLSPYSWSSALQLNPYDCFTHVAGLDNETQQQFKAMLLKIADMAGNKAFRVTCAKHLFEFCKLKN